MKIGSRIYYEKVTGNLIQVVGERSVGVETTIEQDLESYLSLSDRNPDSVGMIQLEYGQYRDDYVSGGVIYGVDLDRLVPLFQYPDELEPEEPRQPLSEEVEHLKQRLADSESRNDQLAEESTINQIALMELHIMILGLTGGEPK
ncbi:hypothetical protein JCM10914A_10230 [Paenibacillus sp. JCM 10914]|uniref:hypothetical protein n=1 Tax=Paenibacillus sp. JCM 10914 TaxID=1236974 RepID=UPI0003CC9B4E|nr:hypothetical protein [Paenibacillus sp. JCM 10914]GAE07285.1 hypothetical protein JCM10914_3504 [Paenibacillus sp. JCM 10914]